MARRYKKNNAGLRILCVVLALILAAGLTIGGLELWGTGKMKPSNWGKQDDLAPVTISFTDDTAPFGVAQTFESGARAYALSAASTGFPSTKRATATCTLPEGGSPDRYEWEITGGEGLSFKTVNSDGSAADITAQKYFNGTATLTARAYRGSELRGIGSIGVRALQPKPEQEPLLASLVLFDLLQINDQYQHDLYTFKNKVLPNIAEDIALQELSTNAEKDQIQTLFESIPANEADLVVIFDNGGIIVNTISPSFDLLTGIAFLVIDDKAYAAEEVEAAGGYYLTTDGYDTNDARVTLDEWNTYGQEIALKYHTYNTAETVFDAFIDELFDYSAQEFSEGELGDLYSQYAYEYDVVICVSDIDTFSRYYYALDYALDNPSVVTWIVGNYYCGEGYDPSEQLYTDYPNLGKTIAYQRQLNTRGIINAIIGLMNGEDISEYFAFNYIRISP